MWRGMSDPVRGFQSLRMEAGWKASAGYAQARSAGRSALAREGLTGWWWRGSRGYLSVIK